jgi:predicted glycosyltransferase/peptidoglycan/xylan/chitin deacetylase (PgdA/CDA1 family)
MSERPAILFYCQHSLGLGHLMRSFALADRLAERFRLVLLNGGRLPKRIAVPANIELVNLPPLGIDDANQLVSHDKRISVKRALERRQQLISATFDKLRPAVVLVELFPFGRKKFASELLPLLEAAHAPETRALVVCSLRDILVRQRKDQLRHDNRAAALANEFFDAIFVHSDHSFARFEESFQPNIPLRVPVKHTGFVVPRATTSLLTPTHKRKRIVVSAGGGIVGEPLLRACIEAHDLLAVDREIEMKIIAGPFLSEAAWRSLRSLARGKKRLRLVRQVSDLSSELHGAAVSISQAGYNTCLDVLRAGVPALLVPFAKDSEDEQRKRAVRLQERGAVRVIEQQDLTPALLATEIRNLMDSKFSAPQLDLRGAETSAILINAMLRHKSALKSVSSVSWFDPLRRALDSAQTPIPFFFRNDDVGWEDARLLALLDLFNKYNVPIDLAVIPESISQITAKRLCKFGLVSIHQHGYAHLNHEPAGRKCEFGESRSRDQQLADITAGKQRLLDLFGPNVEPIFTPPWNRCTAITADCLRETGFMVLSRDVTAAPLPNADLVELPVSIDWFAKRKKVALTRNEIGELLAAAASGSAPVGVMLHHAVMNGVERERLGELLKLLSSHSQAQCVLMRELVPSKIRRAVS